LSKTNRKLPRRAPTPASYIYCPDFDTPLELDATGMQYFQELFGIPRWATELGRVDILDELSILSSYQYIPRRRRMEQLCHIFDFLKHNPKITLYMDPDPPTLDPSMFNFNIDPFKEYYRDAHEEHTFRMPETFGKLVTVTAYIDASHAANKVTRRSHTGFILFVMKAPIIWYSKRQNTVESSTFSSEFIAMKYCVEAIHALLYRLRMFGVPLDGPTKTLCDNESMPINSSKFESTLHKRHSSIAYHATRWAIAAGVILVGWIPSH